MTLESGRRLVYDRLLLATGSQAIGTRVPGAELDGVVTLDGMDDARDIVARCGKGKVAVVVGGGITALEIVEGLRARGVHVHYFMRKDRYWSNVLSESESRIVELALRREGVEIHPSPTWPPSADGAAGWRRVETGAGDVIPLRPRRRRRRRAAADRAGARGRAAVRTRDARGRVPARRRPRHLRRRRHRRDGRPATGHRTLEVLWNAALLQGPGRRPEHGDASPSTRTCRTRRINVTRLAGLHTTIIGTVGSGADADLEGLSRGDSQIWSELCDAGDRRGAARRRPRATGARRAHHRRRVVMGDQALSYPLQELIEDARGRDRGRGGARGAGSADRRARSTASGRTGGPAAPGVGGAAGARADAGRRP